MIKAVVFDVDGTIVNSVNLHAQAWQEAFKKFGKQVELEIVRRQIGKGADQLLPVFFFKRELGGQDTSSHRRFTRRRVARKRIAPGGLHYCVPRSRRFIRPLRRIAIELDREF